ncbi:MAG TPA: alpha/beta hydrolase [Actinospica sp.]|jgi:2,6-dihydroxypseudooxynicotine hydrolase|nr:alpha/beta hydrolase [Actinospica sp.]
MDDLVASAIANWAPRFTTNGVAVSDFERITRGLERWADWCDAWSAVGAEHRSLAEEAEAEGRLRSAGQHFAQAAVYYHFAKFMFVRYPARMRAAHAEAVQCLDRALPYLDPPGRRVEIPYDGARLVGVLRLPTTGPGPHPLVVMIPGLDSTKEEFRTTEALFLERGVGTFSVDGPGQGEAEYDLPIRADWEKPGGAVIDAVSRIEGVDPQRIAVWGISLGGYYAPRVAAGDARVKACVALAGPYNLGACWEELPALTREAFQSRSHLPNAVQARAYARTLGLDGHASSIRCPLLVVAGKRDRLFPWQDAERLVSEAAGPTSFLLLENGNHGCMNVAALHRFKTADWVAAQLGDR